MKFSCPLIFGLMFSCICFTGSSEKLTVNQSPSIITVNEGESAKIFCCWKTILEHKVKVAWYINETKLLGVKEHQTQNCSTLDLTNILKNHTGHYVCEVTQDIPVLLRGNGTGTDLSVRVRQLQKTTTDNVHIVSTPPTIVHVPPRLPAASSSETLTVNQSPSIITVNEGESAQITCCWKKILEHKVKVVWFINETKLSGVKEYQTQNCSTLDLTNILKNRTGHYVCEVTQDIPVLLRGNGTGTDLSVRVRRLQKTTTDNVHIVSTPPTIVHVPPRLPAASSSETLTVNQRPSIITVNEGESAQITCCWKKILEHKVKVVWFINETKLSGVKEYQTQNCSTLDLTNILKNRTGHYVCEVTQDIPVLLRGNGTGTDLSVRVRRLQKTTTDNVHIVSTPPTIVHVPPRLPAASSSREVVIIYIFRSLPFICLLMTFFYLNRDDKQATVSKPEEGLDEDLKAGETQINQTELSEQEKGRDNSEKPEVTAAATEEQKNEEKETVVVVDVEQDSSSIHGNENKSVSVLDTSEKTNLMADVEDVTVSVLDAIVSAL